LIELGEAAEDLKEKESLNY